MGIFSRFALVFGGFIFRQRVEKFATGTECRVFCLRLQIIKLLNITKYSTKSSGFFCFYCYLCHVIGVLGGFLPLD